MRDNKVRNKNKKIKKEQKNHFVLEVQDSSLTHKEIKNNG